MKAARIVVVVAMVAGSMLLANEAPAADPACAPVIQSSGLILKTPGSRTFVTPPQGPEVLSIVATADAYYMRNPDGTWRQAGKRHVGEKEYEAAHAKAADLYRECKIVGRELVDGTPTAVYQYSYEVNGTTVNAKMWLGADGLPRKAQRAGGPTTRYEYGTFKAPIP